MSSPWCPARRDAGRPPGAGAGPAGRRQYATSGAGRHACGAEKRRARPALRQRRPAARRGGRVPFPAGVALARMPCRLPAGGWDMHYTRFKNEPICDYANDANVKGVEAAVQALERGLGARYPAVIGGRRVETEKTIVSLCPALPDRVVGRVASCTRAHVDEAVAAAQQAFAGLGADRARGARRRPGAPGRAHPPRPLRLRRAARHGDRQGLVRGRRRDRRGDRLLRVLRPAGADALPVPAAHAPRHRGQLLLLHPAGRRRGDRAVELPARHPRRHDHGRRRERQHRSCSSRPRTRR